MFAIQKGKYYKFNSNSKSKKQMKKITILFAMLLMTFVTTNNVLAQTYKESVDLGVFVGKNSSFGQFAIDKSKNLREEYTKVKNLVVDEKNFYVFQYVKTLVADNENPNKKVSQEEYHSFVLFTP